jgi:hypothetical protein
MLRTLTILALITACTAVPNIGNRILVGTMTGRPDVPAVQLLVSRNIREHAVSASAGVPGSGHSSPRAAIPAVTAEWNGTIRRLAEAKDIGLGNWQGDRQQAIALASDPEDRSVLGDNLAVTVVTYDKGGAIVDSRVLVNPVLVTGERHATFSNAPSSEPYNLQSVIAHELRLALGTDRFSVASSPAVWGSTKATAWAMPGETIRQASPAETADETRLTAHLMTDAVR